MHKISVSRQLPIRTIPYRIGIGPDEWIYWFIVALVGSSPTDCGSDGRQLGYIFIWWGIVPRGELS